MSSLDSDFAVFSKKTSTPKTSTAKKHEAISFQSILESSLKISSGSPLTPFSIPSWNELSTQMSPFLWPIVCARCSRTEASPMKRGWRPSKTSSKRPGSWLRRLTGNTTRSLSIFFLPLETPFLAARVYLVVLPGKLNLLLRGVVFHFGDANLPRFPVLMIIFPYCLTMQATFPHRGCVLLVLSLDD